MRWCVKQTPALAASIVAEVTAGDQRGCRPDFDVNAVMLKLACLFHVWSHFLVSIANVAVGVGCGLRKAAGGRFDAVVVGGEGVVPLSPPLLGLTAAMPMV